MCRKVSSYSYLYNTISSLFVNMKTEDRNNIYTLVFITDFDLRKRREVIINFFSKYSNELNSGPIQLIAVNETSYPPLSNLKRNYNDAVKRIFWRSKQVIDFAFMMHYAEPLSTYYIQIEDDVVTIPNFVDKINLCIANQTTWTAQDFSELGFIRKFFAQVTLPGLHDFLSCFMTKCLSIICTYISSGYLFNKKTQFFASHLFFNMLEIFRVWT